LITGERKFSIKKGKGKLNVYFKVSVSPKTAEEWKERGVSFSISGEYEKAIECFDKAIELNPNLTKAYINRGNAYYYLEQYEKAIEDYSKAIEIDPDYARAYNNRGNAYRHLKQYERAIEDYNKAIEIDPDYAWTYNSRGLAYYNLEQYEKAIEDYNRAIELDPNLTEAYNNREIALSKLKEQKATQGINCAAYALSVLLDISPEILMEDLAPYTVEGAISMYGVLQVAKEYGLDLIGAKLTYRELMALSQPAIAHFDLGEAGGHYVVVMEATKDSVTYIDNGVEKTVSRGEFAQLWTGYILINSSEDMVVEPHIDALKDEDSDVREGAAEALGEIGDKRAVEPLILALKDEDWIVREGATGALGEIGDERAVEPLTEALKDENYQVREAAKKALADIQKQKIPAFELIFAIAGLLAVAYILRRRK